ncbi:hypothetical protein GGI08_007373 [Coemansia sp. S2]|nr:hypothetical protein GGI08_007373 [Coemansia sp. S2]
MGWRDAGPDPSVLGGLVRRAVLVLLTLVDERLAVVAASLGFGVCCLSPLSFCAFSLDPDSLRELSSEEALGRWRGCPVAIDASPDVVCSSAHLFPYLQLPLT